MEAGEFLSPNKRRKINESLKDNHKKEEAQPTDLSVIALSSSDPYRIQNIKFYEI
jgi:hypothetical protein